MRKCQFIKTNNKRCNANAIKEDGYCFWHSEKTREQRGVAVMTGGKSPKRNYENEEVSLRSTNDVIELIEKTVNELRRNKTSTRIANAIGYLAGISLKAIEQSDLEKRLEVVEYALKIKRQDNRSNR